MTTRPLIGTASMEPDATIVMLLQAEGPEDTLGSGMNVVRPHDAGYAKVLAHLDGMAPGQSQPITAWD